MRANGTLDPAMYSVLESWYDFFEAEHMDSMPHVIGEVFSFHRCCRTLQISFNSLVYISTSPVVAYSRMRARSRHEESTVSFTYLEQLDQLHGDWLNRLHDSNVSQDTDLPVLVINADGPVNTLEARYQECLNELRTFSNM